MSDADLTAVPEQAPEPRSGPSNGVLIIVAAVIVLLLAGGGWLVVAKVVNSDSKSSQALPATVLPATTIAFATVDANPSVTQKVDLLAFIGKFPALKGEVKVGPQDDPRKWVIEQILKSECPSMTYAKDFAPWIGKYAALGAVDVGADGVAPVAAIQETDGSAATSAVKKMTACSKTKDFLFTVTGGYVLASDSQAHLDTIAAAAKTKPLSADATYTKWSGRFAGQGIVSFYVAPSAINAVAKELGIDERQAAQQLKKAVGSFTGAAGYFGATQDGLELKMAIGSKTAASSSAPLGSEVTGLPADTALAVGFGVAPSWSKQVSQGFLDGFDSGFVAGGRTLPSPAQIEALIKQHTGLTVPQDLATLFGRAVVLSLGGNAPADLSTLQSPLQLPIGLKIDGDPAKIRAVIAKVEAKVGGTLEQMGLVTKVQGSDFILATNPSYAKALSGSGSLGSDPAFVAAVANAPRAGGIFFLRFDSAWRTAIITMLAQSGMPDAQRVEANTAKLSALGVSSWTEGDAALIDVRVTTK